MGKKCIPWALAGLLVAVGCGGPRANLRAENASLQSRVDDLRASARRDRQKIRDLENQLFLLEDKLETATMENTRVADPDLPVEVLEPDDAAADRGYQVVGVDDDGNQIVYVGEAARDRSVAPRLPRYTNEDAPPPAPPVAMDDVPVAADDDRIPVTRDVPTIDRQLGEVRRARAARDQARSAYQRHYAALRAGKHAAAIAGFRGFVARYPDHDYADNAQYWLGEALYDQKQYKAAMREFRRVVKNYPRGNKVADALLKIGYCYASVGEPAKARDVLTQVTRVYPKSNPAKLAARKLAALADEEKPQP